MDNDFIVFGAPQIQDPEIEEVVATLKSGWLGTGPKVARFEAAFAEYKSINSQKVAAVNSGTAALHLSLLASGVRKGDEVIAPAMTFCATINAIIHSGATPVLADVEADSMNIDPDDIERRITEKTRAILPVHFAGRPCNMDRIMEIANRYNLKVIEDCAHAIETEYKGKKAGTFGDFGCFSFYVTKNVATGEGGMVIAKKDEDISRIKVLALHGMNKDAWHRFGDEGYKHYQVTEAGFKYNMMDIQAAIGIHQLERVDENLKCREAIWNRYQDAFSGLPVIRPSDPEQDTRHARHLYTLLIDQRNTALSRDQFLIEMTNRNIGIGVHYQSIASHPYYQDTYHFNINDYPNSKLIGEQTISLPLSPELDKDKISRIINSVIEIIDEKVT
jgi:dTDP-4-amino-4,6-dideoxygalactose transaminase